MIIIDGTRVGDVRVYEDEIMQTVISRWGTGGGNVPVIAYSIREDAKANTFSATELKVTNALQAHQPSVQSHHAQTFIVQGEDMEHDPLVMRDREGKAGGGRGRSYRKRLLLSRQAIFILFSLARQLFADSPR